ncbi:chondroadherin-like protein [Schistocerca cancellata]|uniref:chondroadherin-like protein n=1 Tax=Schistocerca cancellata TaxID=274614 RepID=UPI002117807C|nr:chondroadherin-like protein [Schistocerca cancellata]
MHLVLPLLLVLASPPRCGATRPCADILAGGVRAPCRCDVLLPEAGDAGPGLAVDCDGVAWPVDAALPPGAPVVAFSQRAAGLQALPQHALGAPGRPPLRTLDLSRNLLRRLTERLLGSLRDSLVELRLADNLLGDGLNPVFSSQELRGLRRLALLDLSRNQLRALEPGLLEGCTELQELLLDGNALSEVPSSSLNGPRALSVLSLSGNRIEAVPTGAFSGQSSLERLELANNSITTLEGSAFTGLSRLRYLGLSRNRLDKLNSDVFQGADNLEQLDLSQNFLKEVPAAAIKAFASLRHLNLSANTIQTLENSQLASLPDLESLDLSRNRIASISAGTFRGLGKLRMLDLGVNMLRTVEDGTFEGLPALSRLSLLDNNVLLLPAAALSRLPRLSHLQLGFNRVAALSADILRPLCPRLEALSLARNLVRELPAAVFAGCEHLAAVDLSGNLLAGALQGGAALSGVGATLSRLRLSDNRLSALQGPLHLPQLRLLDISANRLTEVPPLSNLTSLLHLNLSSNPQLGPALGGSALRSLHQLQVLDLSSVGLKHVTPALLETCPNLRTVSLKGNQLQEVPEGAFAALRNLTTLDLSENAILNVRAGAFSGLSSLRVLRLQGNRISAFKGEFFRGTEPTALEELDVSRNELSYVFPSALKRTHPLLRELRAADNRLSFFPAAELISSLQFLDTVDLSGNNLKTVDDLDFARLPRLRRLLLARNVIESVSEAAFHNSTQLQELDLSDNRLERIGERLLEGLLRMARLDLSGNLLSELPEAVFERARLHALEDVALARNRFQEAPLRALQRQYFFLGSVDLSANQIRDLPADDSTLVNIKQLDLSENPLSAAAVAAVLSEPKTVRRLRLSRVNLTALPAGPLETPFLRELDLSGNAVARLPPAAFERATLLEVLDVSHNQLSRLDRETWRRLPALRELRLSGNPVAAVQAGDLDGLRTLARLDASDLPQCTRIEAAAFRGLRSLQELAVYGYPRLGFLDVRAVLRGLPPLESLDLEATEASLGSDQLAATLHPRLRHLGLHGRALRQVSGGALAGLRASGLEVWLRNTSVSSLPPALFFALPRSSRVLLDVTGSRVTSLGAPVLSALDERRAGVSLRGLASNPVRCDCHARPLRRWLTGSTGRDMQVTCASPASLSGRLLSDVDDSELTCDAASSTAATEAPAASVSTVPPPADEPDIIWTAKPASRPGGTAGQGGASGGEGDGGKPAAPGTVPGPAAAAPVQPRPNDDTLIIGIVVGVVAFIAILVAGVCVIRGRGVGGGGGGGGGGNGAGGRPASSQYRGGGPGSAPGSTCTCVKPPVPLAPPPVYYTLPGKHGHLRVAPAPAQQVPPYLQGPGPGPGLGPSPYYLAYPAEDKDYR